VSHIAIPLANGVLFKCVQYVGCNIEDSYRSHITNCSLTKKVFHTKYEDMIMAHLRNKFYLSDSEGLLIIVISPEGNQKAFLCCRFIFDKSITLIKAAIFSMNYHNSSFQDPVVRGANVAAA